MGNSIIKFILGALFLVVFNILFFMLCGTDNVTSTWISYGFIHISYLFLLITPFLGKKEKNLAVLNMNLYSISIAYFLTELVTGLIFIFIQPESYGWALSIQLILFALYLFTFLSSTLANNSTRESMEQSRVESTYIKESALQLKMILGQITDKTIYKKVEKCYDLMQSSPTHSIAKVKDLERLISNNIEQLKILVPNGDEAKINQLCNDIKLKTEERNHTLKTHQLK